MIKVAICDDDVATTGRIESMLYSIAKGKFIQIEPEVFWKGEHLAEAVENDACFDIIFLDIEMGSEDGITVAQRIRKTDKSALIVYVTSYENYMKESFSVRPFRFLVKPVGEKEMTDCFRAACDEISSADSYFRYSYQRLSHKILIQNIYYFESRRRKVYIATEKDTLELYGKLNEIEESLKASKETFLRVHQSFLVNYRHIEGLAYDFIVMDNGKRISISEDRRKQIGEQYCAMEDTFYVGR
ncbi:MAG TPA: DNA-binding response regulator [Lachnospiraceae bacterium]|nr:DNA-binding response regulator [Lachnospiraceae bacterium]